METSQKAAPKKVPVKLVAVTAAAALVLVAVLGFATYKFATRHKVSSKVNSAVDSAQTSFDKGDYGKSYDQLIAALPQATSKADKLRLYNQIAIAASSSGKVTEGIKYYEMKHQLDPSSRERDAYNLGTLYDRNSETAKALAEYRIALQYMKSKSGNIQMQADSQALEAVIAEMEKR